MNYLKLALAFLVTLAVGTGLGYYYSPEKIKTVDKIIEKEVTKVVHEKFDPETGKVVERTTTDETKNTTANHTREEILKTKKQYAIKGGVAVNPRDLSAKIIPRIGGEMRLPIFDSWIGVEADINIDRPLIGTYLKLEF